MMEITKADFEAFMAHARKLVPGFAVHDGKRDNFLMNFIDGFIYPFNPKFMDRYVTTIGGDVYYPKGRIDRSPAGALEIAGHELRHAYDVMKMTFPVFMVLYLSVLVLIVPALIYMGIMVSWAAFLPFGALGVHAAAVAISPKLRKITGFPLMLLTLAATVGLFIYLEGWGALWFASLLLLLLPWPAPGRAMLEFKGYRMSILLELKLFGKIDNLDRKVRQFTGPAYNWMMPFESFVRRRLETYRDEAIAGTASGPVFDHVQQFLDRLSLQKQGSIEEQ